MYEEWFQKAEEDEKSTRAIFKGGGAPSTACFLSHQVAEKCLKALLVFHKKPFPKIHDLLQLETLLLKMRPDIKKCHADLRVLNRYYIETRYPGDFPEFTEAECKNAFKAAKRIKKYARSKIR
jgi:HEPN domain-containing protein